MHSPRRSRTATGLKPTPAAKGAAPAPRYLGEPGPTTPSDRRSSSTGHPTQGQIDNILKRFQPRWRGESAVCRRLDQIKDLPFSE